MEAVINSCPAFAICRSTSSIDFTLAGLAAAIVARNILEHGLKRGELINVNVPAVSPEDCEGMEVTRMGRRIYHDELIRAGRPSGHPLLLDRRAGAVGDQRARHRLQRGGQPAGLGDPDPPRPHGPPTAAPAAGLGLGSGGRDGEGRRGADPGPAARAGRPRWSRRGSPRRRSSTADSRARPTSSSVHAR